APIDEIMNLQQVDRLGPQQLGRTPHLSIPRSPPVVHTLVARKAPGRAANSASRSPVTASARPYIGQLSMIRPPPSRKRRNTSRSGLRAASSVPTSKARHVPSPMTGRASPVDGIGRVSTPDRSPSQRLDAPSPGAPPAPNS